MSARIGRLGRTRSSVWLAVAVGGIGFQVLHLVEHVAQLGYWGLHPNHAPWLTPWAEAGRDALAVGGDPATGSELLHLTGNVVFLAGLAALTVHVRRTSAGRIAWLRPALTVQGFHVVEHVLLTASWVLSGRALGFSTLFGALSGTTLSTYRIWWHFLVNVGATALAVAALLRLRGQPGRVEPGRAMVLPRAG